MLRLLIKPENAEEWVRRLDDGSRARFGRAVDNDLVIPVPYVSRHHGAFVFEAGQWYVEDSGSRTGTAVADAGGAVRELRSERSAPLQGGEEIHILGTRIAVERKPDEAAETPAPETVVLSRIAEAGIGEVASLEAELFQDRQKLGLVLGLAKELGGLASLEDVLRRVGQTVFEALRNATHFAVCVPAEAGGYEPRVGIRRDGTELPGGGISISQSILDMVVERQSAMLFHRSDPGVDPSRSIVMHAIASSIAVPLRGARGDLGVLLVDNRSSGDAFDVADLDYVIVLANHATTALERAGFQAELARVFEGFVDASVTAIEARDPTTSGHSRRVAGYSVALAEAADRAGTGPLGPISFSPAQLTELSYAAQLHDFGKVAVPECVLVKARRLYPEQREAVEARFQLIRATRRNAVLHAALDAARAGSAAEKQLERVERECEVLERELAEQLERVRRADDGASLTPEAQREIRRLGERLFTDAEGRRVAYLLEEEVRSLCIPRGTLTAAQRAEIQAHVTHSFRVLSQLPWPETLRRIPEIVHAHHEKLDGTGYPRGLAAGEIPAESRLLSVCDIFDAVTASDRPYRAALPVERGLDLLRQDAAAGKIDPDWVELFIDARIWERR